MNYRKAEADDIPELVRMRRLQLLDEGQTERDISGILTDFFERRLTDGTLDQWVAEDGGAVIATGAIMISEFPPNFRAGRALGAYVTNMYTSPAYRGRGIATAILNILEGEARSAGASRLWLGASDMGRSVYEAFGFVRDGRQMKKELE